MNSLLEGIRLQVCKGPKAQSWLLTCLLPTNFLAWGVGIVRRFGAWQFASLDVQQAVLLSEMHCISSQKPMVEQVPSSFSVITGKSTTVV